VSTFEGLEAASGWPWERLEDLQARELRLYALGWGDHLPVEVRERIEVLRQRRLELEGQDAADAA